MFAKGQMSRLTPVLFFFPGSEIFSNHNSVVGFEMQSPKNSTTRFCYHGFQKVIYLRLAIEIL
jgi:hypothetical protein